MRNRAEDQITVLLIRHGRTASNREHRYLGKTDEGLDLEGKRELLSLKESGTYPKPDRLFISPMRRCLETAEILYPDMEYTVIPEWTEMDFGLFEGKNYKELSGLSAYQEWIDSNGTFPFPDGESRESFILRSVKGFFKMMQIMEKNTAKPLTVACIVHGGTIMALLSHFCGGEYFDYQIPNGGVYRWIPARSFAWRPDVAAASGPADREADRGDGEASAGE